MRRFPSLVRTSSADRSDGLAVRPRPRGDRRLGESDITDIDIRNGGFPSASVSVATTPRRAKGI
jgi:hypothetical protein